MGLRAVTGPLLAAVTGALAGCGSGGAAPPPSGAAVFSQACSACHSLSGHDDPRRQGGDLLGFRASRTQMRQLAGEMPVRHALHRSELDAVVRYVIAAEDRASRH
jgi:mono/diheme cytochrome c family protein